MIKNIIFDLDDTLCDYTGAKNKAVNKLNEILEVNMINQKAFWAYYERIEPKLFEAFTLGKLCKEDYRTRRYLDVLNILGFKHSNIKQLVDDMNCIYMGITNNEICLYPEIQQVLTELKKRNILLIILTNGPTDGQKNKIQKTKLTDYVAHIFYAEEIGFSKPQPESYKFVLNKLNIDIGETIMVGDSVQNDYGGAVAIGMRAILIDRENKYYGFNSNDKISTLAGLLKII